MTAPIVTIHLIANAHLDPVWLWDSREGLNEGLATVRTVLDLMSEYPELTFTRGEAAIYQHIEREDPATFERILKMFREGRWEIVGGTYIQPDHNMPRTEMLARQFTWAQRYFASRFQFTPSVGWAADCFGHSGGLPEIFQGAGIRSFAFTRPEPEHFDPKNPAFWWQGTGGSRILTYRPPSGWYGTERDQITKSMNSLLVDARKFSMRNVACFWGMGNHGGGPTRRQLGDIRQWANEHSEAEIIFSGLHRFFKALVDEEKTRTSPFPLHRGELNFTKRGCYTSTARFKHAYRKAEAQLLRAEKTDSAIRAFLAQAPGNLKTEWEGMLFNAFHDILPGTSIERATFEQIASVNAVGHGAAQVEFRALNALASQISTVVPQRGGDRPNNVPILVWNPHPYHYRGPIELEAAVDYRPVWAYENRSKELPIEVVDVTGQSVPFQRIATEHNYAPELPWRVRVVFHGNVPPLGWSVFQLGWSDRKRKASKTKQNKRSLRGGIQQGSYRIVAQKGAKYLQITRHGKSLLPGKGLSVSVVADPWGAWGGLSYEPGEREIVEERWAITDVCVREQGDYQSVLWVRFSGKQSRIDFTFTLHEKHDAVNVHARVFWNDRSRRLRLELSGGAAAEYEVPGGSMLRGNCGEVPGLRWARVIDKAGKAAFGFASNALYGFRCSNGMFAASIVRGTCYSNNLKTEANEIPWLAPTDCGELTFRFLLTPQIRRLPQFAEELEEPLVTLPIPSHRGDLPTVGSLLTLYNANARLLALKSGEEGGGWVVRVLENAGSVTHLRGKWLGSEIDFGTILPRSLNSFRIVPDHERWRTIRTTITELENAT